MSLAEWRSFCRFFGHLGPICLQNRMTQNKTSGVIADSLVGSRLKVGEQDGWILCGIGHGHGHGVKVNETRLSVRGDQDLLVVEITMGGKMAPLWLLMQALIAA